MALEAEGPVCLLLTRQDLPVLGDDAPGAADGVAAGAYVLAEGGGGEPDAVIIATGSEVEVALDAREQLAGEGIAARVVSMPSRELFEKQDSGYADSVLPPGRANGLGRGRGGARLVSLRRCLGLARALRRQRTRPPRSSPSSASPPTRYPRRFGSCCERRPDAG